jgi:TonB family protein
MYRRLTLLVLMMASISGAAKVASAQSKETPLTGKLKDYVIYAPRPQYPDEARAKRLMGSGIVSLDIDPATGSVTSARMLQSTGHKILDDAALAADRLWRFKPGTVSAVRISINFTMGGAKD